MTTGVHTLLALSVATAVASCAAKREPAPAARVTPAVQAPAVHKPAPASSDEVDAKVLTRFLPSDTSEATAPPDPAKIALGRAMFYDKRLSRRGETACSSCHMLGPPRMDGQVTSKDAKEEHCVRGTSAVAKVATPEQRTAVATMQKVPGYAELFAKAFPDDHHPMTLKNAAEAIAAFERGLVTASRWDRYVRGESGALSEAEKHGLKAFLDAGCQSCHSGPDLGGTMFQKLGAVIPWPAETTAKAGRSSSDNKPVKVPSLKVTTLYARYFRDSTSTKLRESIQKMGYHQLGIRLSDDDIAAIAVWMQSLTGELDVAYAAAPPPLSENEVADLH